MLKKTTLSVFAIVVLFVIAFSISAFKSEHTQKATFDPYVYFAVDDDGNVINPTNGGRLGENPFDCSGFGQTCAKGYLPTSPEIQNLGSGMYRLLDSDAEPDNEIEKTPTPPAR